MKQLTMQLKKNDFLSGALTQPALITYDIKQKPVLIGTITRAVSTQTELPPYSGPYVFTPTRERQVVETNERHLQSDIIINPIPKNYGLITWNGSILTVS